MSGLPVVFVYLSVPVWYVLVLLLCVSCGVFVDLRCADVVVVMFWSVCFCVGVDEWVYF